MPTIRSHPCVLTTRDHAILATMLSTPEDIDPALLPLLRRKLSFATVVAADEIGPNVVTLNSRVRFRVDDGRTNDRIVVRGEDWGVPGMTIPVTVPRGLALLGLAEGQGAVVARKGEPSEWLLVVKVAYQPEAGRAVWGAAVQPAHADAMPPAPAATIVRLDQVRRRLPSAGSPPASGGLTVA